MINLIEIILKGGFGILIARIFISNVNDIFNKRSREVHIAKMLKHEIEKNTRAIKGFLNSIDNNIHKNKDVKDGTYICTANSKAPSLLVFENNYNQIFNTFEKYSKNSVESLNEIYSVVKNYEIVLSSYRDLYLKFSPVNLPADPNIKYKVIALSAGLGTVDIDVQNAQTALELIQKGRWYWGLLKNHQAHKVIALLFGLLLIGIPRTDEL